MLAWTYPLVSPTWHDKMWFFGPGGSLGMFNMEIGLTSYQITAKCDTPTLISKLKAVCGKDKNLGSVGMHDLAEMMDFMCNLEETTHGVVRGCDQMKLLYYVSIVCIGVLCLSLLPMVAGCFGMLYFETGYHNTYQCKAFCMAMYYTAPCLQLIAISAYGLLTHTLDEMFNPGMLRGLFVSELFFNSPKVVTLAYGYAIAFGLMSACFVLPCFTAHYLQPSEEEYLYDEYGNPISPDGYYSGEAYGTGEFAGSNCAAPSPGYGQYGMNPQATPAYAH